MKTKKLDGPEIARRGAKAQRVPPREKVRGLIEEVYARGVEPPDLITCEPQSKRRRLERYLPDVVEPRFLDEAESAAIEGGEFKFAIVLIDKSRQNPLNKLGGMKAGDEAMKAYWDMAALAATLMSEINGGDSINIHLTRVSPTSDEGIVVIGGLTLTEETSLQFEECLAFAKEKIDLKRYTYSIEVPVGHNIERFDLDLEAFSKVLYHPDMVITCSRRVSGHLTVEDPLSIDTEISGFLLEEIRILENEEIEFWDLLPESFKGNGGLAEVKTPFNGNLVAEGIERSSSGCFVEIKLEMPKEDAMGLRQFIDDDYDEKGSRGTRKGFAEVNSRRIGMRGLNTFIGKAGTNRILTPIAQAMGDLERQGIVVTPVTGAYLQYWLDLPANDETHGLIVQAINRRIHAKDKEGYGYIDLKFKPHVTMIRADDIGVRNVRARFILNSLERYPDHVELLERTDFVLNFIEDVADEDKQAVYNALAKKENGGKPISGTDLHYMELVQTVCRERRTIRDTEDFIWTLHMDKDLPEEVRLKRAELEQWLFDFSCERAQRMFYLLLRRMKERKEQLMEG